MESKDNTDENNPVSCKSPPLKFQPALLWDDESSTFKKNQSYVQVQVQEKELPKDTQEKEIVYPKTEKKSQTTSTTPPSVKEEPESTVEIELLQREVLNLTLALRKNLFLKEYTGLSIKEVNSKREENGGDGTVIGKLRNEVQMLKAILKPFEVIVQEFEKPSPEFGEMGEGNGVDF